MKKRYLIFFGLVLLALTTNAQQLKEGYIDRGKTSENFGQTLNAWSKGQQITEDDNFFISRVKPKLRFRNVATQVNQDLDASNDKRLLCWLPINNEANNALPDGIFDSEVFPMWSYVSHYGNWSTPFVRMPGNFADVAHKNGVGVSVVAGIPYGTLAGSAAWVTALNNMINAGSDKMADFLEYYGVDGLGYNSEFSGSTSVRNMLNKLHPYHKELVDKLKETGRMPLFENIWYDGTNESAGITFDRGLDTHNDDIWGYGEGVKTSLFFNYNWNKTSLIDNSIAYAQTLGRDPLELYCGVNMQGAEPRGTSWPLLEGKNLSIGLWGAHSKNMFFESRGEKGSQADVQQRTYLQRVERWFTGGTRNPVNTPEVSNSMKYNADNYAFFGMSKFMTAKSTLSWDLSDEPFVTHFNLGNGKFFNWEGQRQSDREWYNIGVQDYLPTWRWWFADKFMGRTPADIPASGLDAEFTWNDAWMGGSLMRIYGTTADEYLHLFKTQFALQSSDTITVRYKVMGGTTDLTLALSAEGDENEVLSESNLQVIEQSSVKVDEWVEKQFIVRGPLNVLNNKTLAMVALHFTNASNLDLYVGEFSIVRGAAQQPEMPVIAKTEVLAANYKGVDGKIIFNMPHDKGNDVCYNLDVKTSLFKLYAQQEGKEPILMCATTSWAGLYFSVPVDFEVATPRIRFGVSAVSLDMKAESDIAWGEYKETGVYEMNDNISINKTIIKPNEDFEIIYVDPKHEPATWELFDEGGSSVKKIENAITFSMPEGLAAIGNYTLVLTGKIATSDSTREDKVRTFGSYVQVTTETVGALPKVLTLTANDETENIDATIGTPIALKYTGRSADGLSSQGIDLQELGFGFKAGDAGMEADKSFTLAFWIKVNQYNGGTNLLNIRDKTEGWPKTDWGWLWNHLTGDGTFANLTFRGADPGNNELRYFYDNTKIEAGPWTHMAYVFDFEGSTMKFHLYVNGVKQEVTGWNRSTDTEVFTTEPPYQGGLYPMKPGNIVAIGGSQFDNGGVDGTLDNFQYWSRALTAEEVKSTMGDINVSQVPEGLAGYWNFEEKAGEDGTFANQGSKESVPSGRHDYIAAGGEGQGSFRWEPATYAPGCPFVPGTAYQVVTTPKWSVYKGDISDVTGTDLSGAANVSFADEGIYTATLTLENGWGKDSKTFSYITVTDKGSAVESIDMETELSAYPNPFIDHVNVRFAKEGDYMVRIYDMNGRLVGEKNQRVEAGEFMQLGVNGGSGSYIVQILRDNKLVRAVKLLKK